MSSALRLLMRLQARAAVRRALRAMQRPKGAIFTIVGVLVFVLWLGPVLFSVTVAKPSNPEIVRLIAPLFLLLMCGLTLLGGGGDRVISFTPGEVNFLFPGPFSRRELLLYKLARTFGGALFTGFILSIVLLQHASSWPAAFIAGVLAMLLVQLLTLVVVLTAHAVGARAYTIGRRAALAIVVSGVLIALVPAVRETFKGGWREAGAALERSLPARVVLSPFAPFARAFTAQSASELLLWGGVGAGINLVLFVLVLRLDADYREAALAASQKTFERQQRLRRGQFVPQIGGRAGAPRRSRIPMFPWLAGAGPTAWRQLTAALRTSRGMLLILLLLSLGIVPMLFTVQKHTAPVLMAAIWMTLFLTMMLKFDFRAELDQIAWLKALPLGPTATAAGQLVVPVLVLTLAQAILLGSAAVIAPEKHRFVLLALLPFLLPFNLLMIGVENLLFLLFPSRTAGAAPGDLSHMGRQIVFFLLKTLVLAVAIGVATLFAMIAWFIAGQSTLVALAAGFLMLCGMAVGLVPFVGIAYRKFDPSMDMPA